MRVYQGKSGKGPQGTGPPRTKTKIGDEHYQKKLRKISIK